MNAALIRRSLNFSSVPPSTSSMMKYLIGISLLICCLAVAPIVWAQNMSAIEMLYKLTYHREKRDSYYQVYLDYVAQKEEIERSKVKLKINITVEAIETSYMDLPKLRIPLAQYQLMLANKNKQYQKLMEVEQELNSLIELTDIGFLKTQDILSDFSYNISDILYTPEKWQMNPYRKVQTGLNMTMTSGYLPNHATAHKVARIRNRISAGIKHGLLLHQNGLVYSWGADTGGSLGRPDSSTRGYPLMSIPVDLPKNLTVLQLVSSYYSNLVLAGDALYSWGQNTNGEVGDGTVLARSKPFKVFSWDLQGPKKIEQIAAGAYTFFAVDERGKMYAWGKNDRGQLGDRTLIQKPRPVDIYMKGAMLNRTIVRVCAGDSHTLVLSDNNRLFSFGDNTYGQLGIGESSTKVPYVMEPVPVVMNRSLENKTIVDIQCGANHNLVLTSEGKVYAWGQGANGALGTGNTNNQLEPVAITVIPAATKGSIVVKIFTRHAVSFALSNTSQIYSWGSNQYGQLGLGSTTTPISSPTKIADNTTINVLEFAAFEKASVFLTNNGALMGAGTNANKELFNSTTTTTFVSVYTGMSTYGFAMERRKYPFFKVGDESYQFVGDNFLLFPDNGFYLYKKNSSFDEFKLVEYVNNTGRMFQGSIYNTHILKVNDYIYMYGGVVNNTISKAIYRASVSNIEKGWELTRFTLPYTVASGMSLLVDDYFYIFGGVVSMNDGGDDPVLLMNVTSTILRAHVMSPLSFQVISDKLPVPIYSGIIGRSKDYLFIFGGRNSDGDPYADILRASYYSPTKFENTYSVLPYQFADGTMVVTENWIYIFGGFYSGEFPYNSGLFQNQIVAAPSDEPVGSWIVTDYTIPITITSTPVLEEDQLFLFGNDIRRDCFDSLKTSIYPLIILIRSSKVFSLINFNRRFNHPQQQHHQRTNKTFSSTFIMRQYPLVCGNVKCKTNQTPLWRKGWTTKEGKPVMLCNACGLHYKKGHFCVYCNQIYKESDADDKEQPWIGCDSCHRWVHQNCEKSNGYEIKSGGYLCPCCRGHQQGNNGSSTVPSSITAAALSAAANKHYEPILMKPGSNSKSSSSNDNKKRRRKPTLETSGAKKVKANANSNSSNGSSITSSNGDQSTNGSGSNINITLSSNNNLKPSLTIDTSIASSSKHGKVMSNKLLTPTTTTGMALSLSPSSTTLNRSAAPSTGTGESMRSSSSSSSLFEVDAFYKDCESQNLSANDASSRLSQSSDDEYSYDSSSDLSGDDEDDNDYDDEDDEDYVDQSVSKSNRALTTRRNTTKAAPSVTKISSAVTYRTNVQQPPALSSAIPFSCGSDFVDQHTRQEFIIWDPLNDKKSTVEVTYEDVEDVIAKSFGYSTLLTRKMQSLSAICSCELNKM
ncbi:hypothetical protein C9374_014136 [Naegleria lovaniensis]|uniref:Uncharacterized protein n=1 Tax=Naegleria lovaniensis TaxID=51637 RepID=A0AA88KQD7_NAELO|nr:uncharacterized protein C9374_014136 [Naegleria lovaniensis]KAG2389576.1 hypothetical protein C9374_014136 [Naegleria lovaniensis]